MRPAYSGVDRRTNATCLSGADILGQCRLCFHLRDTKPIHKRQSNAEPTKAQFPPNRLEYHVRAQTKSGEALAEVAEHAVRLNLHSWPSIALLGYTRIR